MGRTLLVISAKANPLDRAGGAGTTGPRQDYVALAEALDADILDRTSVERLPVARHSARRGGYALALAWLAFRRRHAYDAIVTDGEHIGIPLALLLKVTGHAMAHVTIGHLISAAKKRPFFRRLHVHTHITRIALHATRQREIAIHELGIPPEQLALVPYQADVAFWQPQPAAAAPGAPLISSVGREFRDYPTLFRAAAGLDARVVIAAGSRWSRRDDTTREAGPPPNVHILSAYLDYHALRDLYARSSAIVVPVQDTDFQAGVTSILEAMAMAKPVIATRTRGQTDVIEGPLCTADGVPAQDQPAGFLREVAAEVGDTLERNGLYVPAGDPAALRAALVYLLAHPEQCVRLGTAARRTVEQYLTVDHFAQRMRRLVDQARAAARTDATTRPGTPAARRAPLAGEEQWRPAPGRR